MAGSGAGRANAGTRKEAKRGRTVNFIVLGEVNNSIKRTRVETYENAKLMDLLEGFEWESKEYNTWKFSIRSIYTCAFTSAHNGTEVPAFVKSSLDFYIGKSNTSLSDPK